MSAASFLGMWLCGILEQRFHHTKKTYITNEEWKGLVILGAKTGQLGNRLFHYAHWLVNSWEYGYTLYNPSFDEYGAYFARESIYEMKRGILSLWWFRQVILFLTRVVFKCMALRGMKQVGNSWLRFYRLGEGEECNLRDLDFVQLRENTKCLVVQGWLYRDPVSLQRYGDEVRQFFRISPTHEKHVIALTEKIRDENDKCVIGLHIRRGDYQNFLGGAYYYTNKQYGEVMGKVKEYFRGKELRWLICSNEPVDREAFSAFDVVLGNGQIVEDMYGFAACDYIVGPPSTYTGWAAFYGKKPIYYIEKIMGEIRFREIDG